MILQGVPALHSANPSDESRGCRLILFLTNFWYELVIPIFEKTMSDGALFHTIDVLVFITPLIASATFLVFLISGLVYSRNVHIRAEDRVTDLMNRKNQKVQKELDRKAEFLKHRYYTNCPNCTGVRKEQEQFCSYCGASLMIPEKL